MTDTLTTQTAGPRWRGDPSKLDHTREWIRRNLPTGRDGFCIDDLDAVIRWYGPNYGLDGHHERFRLIEFKHFRNRRLTYSQRRTFTLMHDLLRHSDPHRTIYDGFYLVEADDDHWDNVDSFHVWSMDTDTTTVINRQTMIRWLNMGVTP